MLQLCCSQLTEVKTEVTKKNSFMSSLRSPDSPTSPQALFVRTPGCVWGLAGVPAPVMHRPAAQKPPWCLLCLLLSLFFPFLSLGSGEVIWLDEVIRSLLRRKVSRIERPKLLAAGSRRSVCTSFEFCWHIFPLWKKKRFLGTHPSTPHRCALSCRT